MTHLCMHIITKLALPLGNGFFMKCKKSLIIKFGAWIQLNVQPIPQLVFHEIDNFENMFLFDITHNLDNNNLSKFHIFRELMVKDGGCKFFLLKLCDWVKFIVHAKMVQHYEPWPS